MRREQLAARIKSFGKKVFTMNDLRLLFPDEHYLSTTVQRLLQTGFIKTLSRGVYSLATETIEPEEVAQKLYYPCYTSFETALARFGIINQGPYDLTLATTRHSKKTSINGTPVEYHHLKKDLFLGFKLLGGFYLAEPEKALLDTLYLTSIGKKKLSTTGWHLESLDTGKLNLYLASFPHPVKTLYLKIQPNPKI